MRRPAPELGPRAQRTIEAIVDATRETFLRKGYGGTSIDDITTAAGTSRASFYTYFPTKRDVLLAIGSQATQHARAAIASLDHLPEEDWSSADFETWIRTMFSYLDRFGGFGFAWTQAAYEDAELRDAGMRTHLATCRRLGERLDELRSAPLGDPTRQGLLVFGMLERLWSQLRLYEPTLKERDVVVDAALALDRLLR